jgi:CO/xanthine dehydrogenase Mo-binding subunit
MTLKTSKKNTSRYGKAEETEYQSLEVWSKVTGKAVYGIDLDLPGMLHGKILRSPFPHARIKRVDASVAEAMPGVRAVLTGAGLEQRPFGIAVKDELPLAVDTVRYVGDEVAAVAAVDLQTAERAIKAIIIEYEELPAVYDPAEALQEGAPQLHDNFPRNLAWQRNLERGSFEAAFTEADLVVEGNFTVPAIHQVYLEPIACVAVDEPYTGITLHTALQSPDVVRKIVAGVLNYPLSKVNIDGPVMGGGFGGRVYGNLKVYILSALLAIKSGRPVKIQLTREEEFIAGRPMIAAVINMKMAVRKDGTILGREADIITDNGAYSAQAPWVSKTLSERNDSVYRIPIIKTRVRLAYTNKIPTGQYRAYGNQVANFATESLIDMAAKKLGLDPLQIRLKNCVREGDITVHGLQIFKCGLSECLRAAAKEIGWNKKKAGHGYGLSVAIHANGSLVVDKNFRGASALSRLELDGRVTLFTGEQDYGQGTHGAFAQIFARALDVSPTQVTVESKQTKTAPFSTGALAMRQTTVGGKAIQLAAEDLKEKIFKNAAELAGEPVTMKNGILTSISGRKLELAEIAYHYHTITSGLSLTGEGKYVPEESDYDESGYGNISVAYSFAAHAVEVELDKTTGALTVNHLVAAHDSGRIVNHLTSRGQVYGGVAQGIGMSCFEGCLFNEGRMANASLADYKIPTSLDLPEIDPLFIEIEDPAGPYGSKGLGEIVMVPVIGAVANAAADAAGVRITDLPLTAEKIYQAMVGRECDQ